MTGLSDGSNIHPPVTRHFIGLDLGQSADFTALCVLSGVFGNGTKPIFQVGHLERFKLLTPYPDIVRAVVKLTQRPELGGEWQLIIDATGVGRAVCDLFKEALTGQPRRIHPMTITGGNTATGGLVGVHVPKRDLVMVLKVMLESKRLQFAGTWPETATLIREIQAFQVKITGAANDTYGAWREGTHDDLVLAVAMAAWWAERRGQPQKAKGIMIDWSRNW